MFDFIKHIIYLFICTIVHLNKLFIEPLFVISLSNFLSGLDSFIFSRNSEVLWSISLNSNSFFFSNSSAYFDDLDLKSLKPLLCFFALSRSCIISIALSIFCGLIGVSFSMICYLCFSPFALPSAALMNSLFK